MLRFIVLLGCLALAACSRSTNSPETPPGTGTISGTEGIQWDQPAASAAELASFRYLLYVDDVGTELANVSCATTAGSAGFTCSAGLPPMTSGRHRLMLTAFVDASARLESERSAPLDVVVAGRTGVATPGVSTVTTVDGVRLRVSTVADGLDEPTDLRIRTGWADIRR